MGVIMTPAGACWHTGFEREVCLRGYCHCGAAHDPASGPEPAPDTPGTADVDAGTGEAG